MKPAWPEQNLNTPACCSVASAFGRQARARLYALANSKPKKYKYMKHS